MSSTLDHLRWQKTGEPTQFKGAYKTYLSQPYAFRGDTGSIDLEPPRRCNAILPLTAKREVISVAQYRPGPEDIMFDMAGGYVEDGEDPVEAAERELLEETGYKGQLVRVAERVPKDAYDLGRCDVFVALECYKAAEPQYDFFEYCEPTVLPWGEWLETVLRRQQMSTNGLAWVAVDWLLRSGVVPIDDVYPGLTSRTL